MIQTVIINRKLSVSETEDIRQLAQSGVQVFAFPGAEDYGFAQFVTSGPEDKKAVNYMMMNEVLQFGDLPVGNRTIAELFCIDTASIWHYHKFRVYFAVRNLMYFLLPLQQKFHSFENHCWFVSSEAKPLEKLFPEINFRFQQTKTQKRFHYRDLFSYLILTTYRELAYLLSPGSKPEYLLYMTEKYSTVLDKKTLKTKQGHHILEYLLSELDGRFALLTEVLIPKIKGKSDYSFSKKQFATRTDRCRKIFVEGFLISGLLSKSVRRSTREAQKLLESAYAKVNETELSIDQELILSILRSLGSSSRFFLFRYFAAKRYFAHSKVRAVIAADENSPLTKSILDAAKFHGIKIIGLQHGTMHDLHPAYRYTPNDCKNHVMPDFTLTWGKYWEQFLVEKGHYPRCSVVPVGQIRTDIIPVLLKTEKQKQVYPAGRIVFASQPQRDAQLRFQAAFDVFTAVQKITDAQLIVKLHPREFGDTSYYSDIAAKTGCKNYIIDKTSDLYQLIASCDVLITCFSTVGTETIYFHKPLVIIDHLRQDIMGYAAEGVAFQATNAENLGHILSEIFKGTLQIDRLKYDSFIQKYAYRIDGKVAERCLETIIWTQ
jgi:hypothetical protein